MRKISKLQKAKAEIARLSEYAEKLKNERDVYKTALDSLRHSLLELARS